MSEIALHVGPVAPGLLAELAAVEALCFDRPWGAAGLAEALAQDGTAVAVAGGDLADAYCLYRRMVDEVEILQLATHPSRQRQGLARRILAVVLEAVAGQGAVFLEVRRSNVAAISLYESAGFVVYGTRRGYYASQEDALLLRRDLT